MSDELKGAINERLKSAIFGTFTIYLILANWEVFIYLFSDLQPGHRIQIINDILKDGCLKKLGIALVLTLITLVVVPLSKNAYDRILMWWNFGTDSYADSLARQREVLDKNGVDKIMKMLSAKNNVQGIYNNVQSAHQDLSNFLAQSKYIEPSTKRQFTNTMNVLENVMKESGKLVQDLDDFKTEVNRITRFKKNQENN